MKKKILVVDDEAQIVRLLSLRLQANNCNTSYPVG
jgi:DNA-binding NtrC family response regulator